MTGTDAAAILAAFGAVGGLGLGVAAQIRRGAERDGKVDAVLERLTDLAEDHEKRLRRGGL